MTGLERTTARKQRFQVRRELGRLTPRQTEVLWLLADGHSTSAIARRLNLSIKTIETHRMADLSIRVVDAAGKPVPNAPVTVTQRKRAFGFGSFVQFANPTRLLAASPDGDRTRDVFTRLFNRGTCPIYWADWGWVTGTRQACRAMSVRRGSP